MKDVIYDGIRLKPQVHLLRGFVMQHAVQQIHNKLFTTSPQQIESIVLDAVQSVYCCTTCCTTSSTTNPSSAV